MVGTSQPSTAGARPPPLERGHKLPGHHRGTIPLLSTPRGCGQGLGEHGSFWGGMMKVREAERQLPSVTGRPEAPTDGDLAMTLTPQKGSPTATSGPR